ncbi:MAG: YggS family pyridoxal phosphate-dependent enzyme [Myxococcota bacterium]|nr:YggS family pyridoxal phosphate-dependent enzyme [Myxococcota bacterium]
MTADAQERLRSVHHRIARACVRAGRTPEEVQLVGVCKRQPIERIVQSIRAGLGQLGENYVQALQERRPLIEAQLEPELAAQLRWRMVGGLQRNKARAAISVVDSVDSVDRASLAEELDKRAAAVSRVIDVCLQVNLSREPRKGGVDVTGLPALLEACGTLSNLRVVGLMTIPAASDDPEASRPSFARLRELRDTLREAPGGGNLHELSMGMSGDFEVAVEEGATLVRVGTALFGARDAAPGSTGRDT